MQQINEGCAPRAQKPRFQTPHIYLLTIYTPQHLHPAGDIDIGRIFFALQCRQVRWVHRGDIDPCWNARTLRKRTSDERFDGIVPLYLVGTPMDLITHLQSHDSIHLRAPAADTAAFNRAVRAMNEDSRFGGSKESIGEETCIRVTAVRRRQFLLNLISDMEVILDQCN
jgi:hypothetical protein